MKPARDEVTLGWVWRSLQEDIATAIRYASDFSGSRSSALRRLSVLLTPPLLCVLAYRLSHWCHRRRLTYPARVLGWINAVVHRADLSQAAHIGPGLYIPHTSGIVFRGHAGAHLTLYFRAAVIGVHPDPRRDALPGDCPTLGDDVTVGVFSAVVGAVTIGDRAFIGAGAIVRQNLGPNTMVVSYDVSEWGTGG